MLDIMLCCIICNILHESDQVELVQEEGDVKFVSKDFDESSSDDYEEVMDQDELEWQNNLQARRESFERKMDMTTSRESITNRGGRWDTAGQLTAQFLQELEEYQDVIESNNFQSYSSLNPDEFGEYDS